ncbi:ribonuclease P protein component [Oscillospiraceae bacterium HV4-5-C5C]|nr:ribonuclease P protein component [Oscillospiraceae bacterium HV4-5-C5C]
MKSIKLKRDFALVYRRGKVYKGRYIILHVFFHPRSSQNRFGFTCSHKYRTAVSRNRMKRLLREACRSYIPAMTDGFDLILTAKYRQPLPEYHKLNQDLGLLLQQAGLTEPAADLSHSDACHVSAADA